VRWTRLCLYRIRGGLRFDGEAGWYLHLHICRAGAGKNVFVIYAHTHDIQIEYWLELVGEEALFFHFTILVFFSQHARYGRSFGCSGRVIVASEVSLWAPVSPVIISLIYLWRHALFNSSTLFMYREDKNVGTSTCGKASTTPEGHAECVGKVAARQDVSGMPSPQGHICQRALRLKYTLLLAMNSACQPPMLAAVHVMCIVHRQRSGARARKVAEVRGLGCMCRSSVSLPRRLDGTPVSGLRLGKYST
jgi:hypothetical protein